MTRILSDEEVLGRPHLRGGTEVRYGSDHSHLGDLRVPTRQGPHPVAVLLHGGCWRSIADRHYMEALAHQFGGVGWATWNLEYRPADRPGGGYPGTFLDVAAGLDHLREFATSHDLDLGCVIVVGHSAGGHLALWLAARTKIPPSSEIGSSDPLPVRAVVGLGGIADLGHYRAMPQSGCDGAVDQLMGGGPSERPARYDAACPARLLPLGVPQLLLTGQLDPDVPPDHVQAYAKAALSAGDQVMVEIVPDAGHFEVVAPWSPRWEAVRPVLVDFLERVRCMP